jgi:hypothetical protein
MFSLQREGGREGGRKRRGEREKLKLAAGKGERKRREGRTWQLYSPVLQCLSISTPQFLLGHQFS